MNLEFDPAIDDCLVTQATFGQAVGIKARQVRNLRDAGVIVEHDGKLPLFESIRRYYQDKHDLPEAERDLDLAIKQEDLKRKQRENREADGEMVKKSDLIPFLRNYSKQVNREFDSIEGQLDGTLIECSSCDSTQRLDGRGRQRVRETVIRMKNHLHDLHNNLAGAKSST